MKNDFTWKLGHKNGLQNVRRATAAVEEIRGSYRSKSQSRFKKEQVSPEVSDVWTPPKDWFKDKTVAILAGGLSMDQRKADIVREKGWSAIAINNAFAFAPWADALLAADAAWWRYYGDKTEHFEGIKIHCQQFTDIPGVKYVPTHGHLRAGANGAMHATLIAKDCGAAKVVLIGVDLRDDQLTHFHGDHPTVKDGVPTGMSKSSKVDFKVYRNTWRALSQGLLHKFVVINANPNSAVKSFPFADLEDIPSSILSENEQ